jgi:hypothetical protein
MREYEIEVTRDGRWWMIHVPEIDQLTQARHAGEIEEMAQSLIAIKNRCVPARRPRLFAGCRRLCP